jgi:hypothetical protein
MSGLQGFLQRQWQAVLLLLVAGGFVVIALELFITDHYSGIQVMGIIAPTVGIVAALWGIFARGMLRTVLALLLLVVAFVGVMGVLQHFQNRGEAAAPTQMVHSDAGFQHVSWQAMPAGQEEGEAGEGGEGGERREGGEGAPPPLAPLGISGLALMGAVILFTPRPDNKK